MKSMNSLAIRNLTYRKGRTIMQVLLSLFLALCICGGSLLIGSLSDGIQSLEARLGADIIVVPSSMKSKMDINNILLNGTTGYFYMSDQYLEQIGSIEGIEMYSPQLFLASLKADCCSAAVQIIGIDQKSDFTIQPWLSSRYTERFGQREVVVGCEIGADVGDSIKIYGENYKIMARLDKTGTGFDTAIYTSIENIRLMMADASGRGIQQKLTEDPETVISAIYIRVKDGFTPEQVADDINIHVRKVEAIQTRGMLSGVAESLSRISGIMKWLLAIIWALCIIIMTIISAMITSERKGEFALMRMMGTSKRELSKLVMKEMFVTGLTGTVLGTFIGFGFIILFMDALAAELSLPLMVPTTVSLFIIVCGTIVVSMLTAMIPAAWTARRLSRTDTGILMREGH